MFYKRGPGSVFMIEFAHLPEIDQCSPRWYLNFLIYLLIELRSDRSYLTKSLNDHQSDSSYSEPFTELIKRSLIKSPDEKDIIEMVGSDEMSVLTYLLLNCCLEQSQLEIIF